MSDSIRLDKWLWYARFYKTRQQAIEAIKAGKIKSEGQRVKPSRTVRPADIYTINRTPYAYTITVKALASRRGSASEAALLYEESPNSIDARMRLKSQLKLESNQYPRSHGRPTKRERRRLISFTRKTD